MQPGENRPGPQACPLHLADESSAWLLLLRRLAWTAGTWWTVKAGEAQ